MSEKKILVVDDEEVIRSTFEMAFSKKGYTVRCAERAEEALEILKDEKILVMFLDLNMPGMNGVELCRKIRKDFPVAIIHAVTGYSSLFEPAECREAGFDVYLNKPVNLEQLFKAAQDAFNKLEM
jgi:CheY-like chemotaxis protein